jgi:hypothetical protein
VLPLFLFVCFEPRKLLCEYTQIQSLTLSAQALANKGAIQKASAAEAELEELKGKVRRAETFFGSANDRDKLFAGGESSDLAVRHFVGFLCLF